MKPVYQTRDNPIEGNCLAASLASIFEDDIDSYPEISDDAHWLNEINDHLISVHGCYILVIRSDEPGNCIKGYHLIFGVNENLGCGHCMVGLDGKTVFNPSRGDDPLSDIQYGVLVKYFKDNV